LEHGGYIAIMAYHVSMSGELIYAGFIFKLTREPLQAAAAPPRPQESPRLGLADVHLVPMEQEWGIHSSRGCVAGGRLSGVSEDPGSPLTKTIPHEPCDKLSRLSFSMRSLSRGHSRFKSSYSKTRHYQG
jgi:hypothetical protein